MTWFFDDETARAKFAEEVASWMDTPFQAWHNAKGVGVDCVQLAGQLMVACGVIEGYDFGSYQLDFAAHTGREMITEWLGENSRFVFLPASTVPMVGDVVVFSVGRAIGHVGVMVNVADFVHSIQGRKVQLSNRKVPPWSERVAGYWRAQR
jgi:hypothetical protein